MKCSWTRAVTGADVSTSGLVIECVGACLFCSRLFFLCWCNLAAPSDLSACTYWVLQRCCHQSRYVHHGCTFWWYQSCQKCCSDSVCPASFSQKKQYALCYSTDRYKPCTSLCLFRSCLCCGTQHCILSGPHSGWPILAFWVFFAITLESHA